MRRLLLAAPVFLMVLGLTLGAAAKGPRPVDVLPFHTDIDAVTAGVLVTSLDAAVKDGAQAFVVELSTPGGDLQAMRTMAMALLRSPIPTVVYVGPPGARAGSAGTFITYAASLAAMAPGTEIGAAHPVGSQGQNLSSVENRKVTNDAVAMITSWAQVNHRNARWAALSVVKAQSLPATAALREHVVNFVAPTLPALVRELDGRRVHLAVGRTVTLHTRGAPIRYGTLPFWASILESVASPNVAYILFTLGFWGLIAEFFHPTLVVGVAGAISLFLGFVGLDILSVSAAGIILLVIGMGLLVADVKATTHGVLSIGGVIAFLLGSFFLFNSAATFGPPERVASWLIAAVTALSVALPVFALAAALRLRSRRSLMAQRSAVGHRGRVETLVRGVDVKPKGTVYVAGSFWVSHSSTGEVLMPGTPVRVVAIHNLELEVEPLPESETQHPELPPAPSPGPARAH